MTKSNIFRNHCNGVRPNKSKSDYNTYSRGKYQEIFPNMFWQTAIVPLLPLLCSRRCLQMGMFGKYEAYSVKKIIVCSVIITLKWLVATPECVTKIQVW